MSLAIRSILLSENEGFSKQGRMSFSRATESSRRFFGLKESSGKNGVFRAEVARRERYGHKEQKAIRKKSQHGPGLSVEWTFGRTAQEQSSHCAGEEAP